MQPDHEGVMREITEQFQPVLDNSPDGVYLWLDETHMIANEHFARMVGYTVDEIRRRPPTIQDFVVDEDQILFAWNYQNRIAPLVGPVSFRFRGKRRDGTTFLAETDMIPLSWRGHAVVYHFVRQMV